MTAQREQLVRLEPVRGTEPLQVRAKLRPRVLPGTNPHIRVVALREDPAVAAGYVGELDHRAALAPSSVERAIGRVTLERNAVHDAGPEADGLPRRTVRTIRTDDDLRGRVGRVDRRALAHLDATFASAVEQERVEPATLRHQDDGVASATDDGLAVAKAELDEVDLFLDDRLGVDRALPYCTHRQPA